LVVAHGGQGSPAIRSAAVAAAVTQAWAVLESGGDAKKSVIAGTVVMEDDAGFNAGTGANVRLDGRTVECDAAIMDWTGDFGAVAGVQGFKNPVLIADAVASSEHLLLAGEGGRALGERMGLEAGAEASDRARSKLARAVAAQGDPPEFWEQLWNFERPYEEALGLALEAAPRDEQGVTTKDTVGVIARDGDGRYAAALSTGGTATALRGRVGDVPQYGQGLFAGPCGAVAATGKGEAIIREHVAAEVYALLCAGIHPDESIRRATWNIGVSEGVGVVAMSKRGYGARATSQMAWAARSDAGAVQADRLIERDRGRWTAR
jgi:isoaspartyl peptidase/L-asparaginase-like protein (Ntn-hydrolase superfamily)